ncbi:MAG TPA: glycosyltransferase family 4 protein [Thermodesulfovibrionales bacterium]|nr:glycosyltransferase family 4 protein [Thermodesulfovibrionales bacterium]
MKILHLLYESKDDYFGIGGVGTRAYEIYRRLRERHDITLLCKRYPGIKECDTEGLRHIFVGTESTSMMRSLLSYAYHAASFVKKHSSEFDIIIEEFSPAVPTFLHLFTKRPIILQMQGYTGTIYFRKYNVLRALPLFLMEQVRPLFYRNFIFVNSETVGNFILGRSKKIRIISNGVSAELFDRNPVERDYMLYFGRIDVYGKGLDILLEAYREFHGFFPDVRLVIAGDGRDMTTFKAMLADLPTDVRRKIALAGWVSGDQKLDLLCGALFAVFPSRHEVQSIAALEALACSRPVIVSDIPGFRYVVRQRAGISFRPGDARSLAEAMKNLMKSSERREMGQRGRDSLQNLSWEAIALQYENFLEEAAEESG